jgi:hypothetical protein
MQILFAILAAAATCTTAAAQQKTVIIQSLGITLQVPAQFRYELLEQRFHTYSGLQGTIKIYLSHRCCRTPMHAAQSTIARSRSGRHPRSYTYMHLEPVVTAGGHTGIRGTFGIMVGGQLRPFVDKHFLPLRDGGVCCISVVSLVSARREKLSDLVLASYRFL